MGFGDKAKEVVGADEVEIVYSGLEEIMCHATKENWDIAIERNLTFRNACFVMLSVRSTDLSWRQAS